jgi:hypothetical protein
MVPSVNQKADKTHALQEAKEILFVPVFADLWISGQDEDTFQYPKRYLTCLPNLKSYFNMHFKKKRMLMRTAYFFKKRTELKLMTSFCLKYL